LEDKNISISEINGCVIIPTYNNEKTLKRVIDNTLKIVDGKYIIIVNDGFND
jgi:glycosyltransferase involved in cell wall biosynthesis